MPTKPDTALTPSELRAISDAIMAASFPETPEPDTKQGRDAVRSLGIDGQQGVFV